MASALIWHQAKHSIPLTFISLFYTMCVCTKVGVFVCAYFFPGIWTENSPAFENKEGCIALVSGACKMIKYNPGGVVGAINPRV